SARRAEERPCRKDALADTGPCGVVGYFPLQSSGPLRRTGAESDRLHSQQSVEVPLQNVKLGCVAVDIEHAVDRVFPVVPTSEVQLSGGDIEGRQRTKLRRLHLD